MHKPNCGLIMFDKLKPIHLLFLQIYFDHSETHKYKYVVIHVVQMLPTKENS